MGGMAGSHMGCAGLSPLPTESGDGGGGGSGDGGTIGGGDGETGGDGGTGGDGSDGGGTIGALGASKALTALPGNGQITLNWADDGVYDLYIIGPINTNDASYPAIADQMLAIYNMSEGEIDPEQLQVLIDNGINVTVEQVSGTSYVHTAVNDMAYFFILAEHVDVAASVSKNVISIGDPFSVDGAVAMDNVVVIPTPDSMRVTLVWQDKPAEDFFIVQRDDPIQQMNFYELEDTTGLTFDDRNLNNGINYQYKIVPVWLTPWGVEKPVDVEPVVAKPFINALTTNPDSFGDGDLNVAGVAGFTRLAVFGNSYDNEFLVTTTDADAVLRAYDKNGVEIWTHNALGTHQPQIAHDADLERIVFTHENAGMTRLGYLQVNGDTGDMIVPDWDNAVAAATADAIKVAADGNYMIAGHDAVNDVRLWKCSSAGGSILASGVYDSGLSDTVMDLIEVADGFVAVVNSVSELFAFTPYAVKFDSDLKSTKTLDLAVNSQVTKVAEELDGTLVATVNNGDGSAANLVRFDPDLNSVISTSPLEVPFGSLSLRANDLYVDSLGGVIVVGRVLLAGGKAGPESHAAIWRMELVGDDYVTTSSAISLISYTEYLAMVPTLRESLLVSGRRDTAAFAVEF